MRLLLGLVVGLSALPANAGLTAEVLKVSRPHCKYLLRGEIIQGDLERLKAAGIKTGDALCLDSFGGNYSTGLDIAEYLWLIPLSQGGLSRCPRFAHI